MGTITLGLVDIGSAVAGFLFGGLAPKIFGGKTTAEGVAASKAEVKALVAHIEESLAKIKAAL